ncbi:MAG: META domain-containing protein [Gloeobacteraceae cyanobacterium ES-bin-316]|nr:META domain-containing protein [Ferruginibacter sp.]
MKQFLLMASAIIFFVSCKTGGQSIAKNEKPLAVPSLSESLLSKQMNSVDFFARGNAPASWTLEMDFGNMIRFKSLDGTEVNSSAVQPLYLPANKATSYTSNASKGIINILVYDEACTDAVSNEKYNKKVVVMLNEKKYEGCGQYLFDAALNGTWILEKINNKDLAASEFTKGLPEIKLDLAQARLSGHDGCNSIGAGFEILGSKIKFNPFISTKMACPNNKPGNDFTHLLSAQTVDYYFKDGKLFFYLPDDSIIVFRKG